LLFAVSINLSSTLFLDFKIKSNSGYYFTTASDVKKYDVTFYALDMVYCSTSEKRMEDQLAVVCNK